MKGISKVLLGLGAAAVMVVASMPVAEAQCATARNLGAGSGNNTNPRVIIQSPFTTWSNGNELGSIWQVGVPGAVNSGGDHFGGGGACPAIGPGGGVGGWIVPFVAGMNFPPAGHVAINASIASPTCLLSNCPSDGSVMITVIEDASDDGSTAAFMAWTVDETPAGFRRWDHARAVNTAPGIYTVTMEQYPTVSVTGSAGPPPNTSLTANYADVALNVKAVAGAGNTAQPASGSVLSYDIMIATSMTDPGRNRGAYSLLKKVPYADAAVVGDSVQVPCDGPASNTFVAVGVTFVDNIESRLVGRAVAVECDPAHADPGSDDLQDRKPRSRTRTVTPSRGR